jgi:hypothetical protein
MPYITSYVVTQKNNSTVFADPVQFWDEYSNTELRAENDKCKVDGTLISTVSVLRPDNVSICFSKKWLSLAERDAYSAKMSLKRDEQSTALLFTPCDDHGFLDNQVAWVEY